MKINKNSIGYAILILMLLLSGAVSMRLYLLEKTAKDVLDIHAFPMALDGWKGKDLAMTERDYGLLGTRNLIFREYGNPSGEKLSLFIVYSETDRAVFHPPEACLLGEGLTTVAKEVETGVSGKTSFSANGLSVEKNGQREAILYSYKAGNIYTNNYFLQQTYLTLQQIFGRRVPGATIRVSMPIQKDEKAARETLKQFLSSCIQTLNSLR